MWQIYISKNFGWGLFTKKSKKIIALFTLVLLFTSVFSQNTDSSVTEVNPVVDESTIFLNNSSDSSQTETESSSSTFGLFFRMILVLVIIILLIYGFVWLLRKTSGQKTKNDPYLKEVANLTFSPGKSVRVVTLKDKAYLIGVTDSNINLISEVEDKDLIDAMNLNAEEKPSDKPKDFASLLASFTKSTTKTEDYLRKRREKLSDSEPNK